MVEDMVEAISVGLLIEVFLGDMSLLQGSRSHQK